MSCCAYCRKPATTTILSVPDHVCLEHALEFWTGLLMYAKDLWIDSMEVGERSTPGSYEQPPAARAA